MGQPSTSNQIRAVALREAVASLTDKAGTIFNLKDQEGQIINRAEAFASYIEHGPEVDPNA